MNINLDKNFFEAEPERLIVKVTNLRLLPVSIKIDNEEQTKDMIVLEANDLTGRFANGYSHRFTPSRKRNSKWQMWLRECSKRLGRSITNAEDILNRYYEMSLEEWVWGENMRSVVPLLTTELTETEARKRVIELTGNAPLADSNNAEAEYVLSLLHGKTYNSALQAVVTDAVLAKDQELVSKIVSKEYMNKLIEVGLLQVDAAGVYTRTSEG